MLKLQTLGTLVSLAMLKHCHVINPSHCKFILHIGQRHKDIRSAYLSPPISTSGWIWQKLIYRESGSGKLPNSAPSKHPVSLSPPWRDKQTGMKKEPPRMRQFYKFAQKVGGREQFIGHARSQLSLRRWASFSRMKFGRNTFPHVIPFLENSFFWSILVNIRQSTRYSPALTDLYKSNDN